MHLPPDTFRLPPFAPLPAMQPGHGLRPAVDADHLSLNQHFGKPVAHDAVRRIFGMKGNVIGMTEKTLDCRLFLADEGHDDFAVFGILTGFADGDIPVEDAHTGHGIALNPKGEKALTPENGGIHHDAFLPLLLGIHGKPGRNPTDNRHFPPAPTDPGHRTPPRKVQISAVAPVPLQVPPGFENLQMLGYSSMGDPEGLGCLPKAGGPAASGDFLLEIFQHMTLGVGEIVHRRWAMGYGLWAMKRKYTIEQRM